MSFRNTRNIVSVFLMLNFWQTQLLVLAVNLTGCFYSVVLLFEINPGTSKQTSESKKNNKNNNKKKKMGRFCLASF